MPKELVGVGTDLTKLEPSNLRAWAYGSNNEIARLVRYYLESLVKLNVEAAVIKEVIEGVLGLSVKGLPQNKVEGGN